MSRGPFVDWRLAERVATGVAGGDGRSIQLEQAAVDSACAEATVLVLDYVLLEPRSELPRPELVARDEWARLGLRTLRELSDELERSLADGLSLPGPLGAVARSLAGAAAGAEAGIAVGYAARKVLGQYDLALVASDRQPRLVFVGQNLAAAQAELGGSPDLFLRWIALHETTHAVQFAAVPWLRDHLAGLLDEIVRGASTNVDLASLRRVAARLLRGDPRATVRTVIRGDLPRLLAGEEHGRTLDRLQAAMSVIEGHAEHVMDAAGQQLDPGYRRMRERLEARRANRGGLGEVISRLLGLELKMRQYRVGKAFCDTIVAEAGVEDLNAVWRDPAFLPSLAELERPREWLGRVQTAPEPAL